MPRRATRTLLLVGPDGAGKSAVAEQVRRHVALSGRTVVHVHARPGILMGRDSGSPVTDPHAKPPRPLVVSLAKLTMLWIDNALGAVVWRLRQPRAFILIERGWYDMAVDLRRYRLPPTLRPLVLALGRLLPRVDTAVIVSAPAHLIAQRKSELPVAEIERQQQAWAGLLKRAGRRTVSVDTAAFDPEQCATQILGEHEASEWRRVLLVPARLEMRATGDAAGLTRIYRPQAKSARAAAPVTRALTAIAVGPAAEPPDFELSELVHSLGLATPSGAVAMQSSQAGRWILGVRSDGVQTVIKVGPLTDAGLQNEIDFLGDLGARRLPFGVPVVRWSGVWHDRLVLATQLEPPRARQRVGIDEIASMCTALVGGGDTGGPIVHGDVAPWNLLQVPGRTLLIDWEQARRDRRPLWDLSHYLLQQGALVGRHTPEQAVDLLTASGSPGWQHLNDVGEPTLSAREHLLTYLGAPPPSDPRALRYRDDVRRVLMS